MKMRANNRLGKVLFVFCLSLVSNYGFADIASVGYVDSVVSTKANTSDLKAVATSGSYNDLTNKPTLSTVATSGSYTDLTNKPTIPTVTDTYDATSSSGMSGKAVASAISTKVTIPSGGSAGQVLKKQSDGSVAWANDIDTDTNTTYTAGTGISVSGTTITNTVVSKIRSGSSTATTFTDIWLE